MWILVKENRFFNDSISACRQINFIALLHLRMDFGVVVGLCSLFHFTCLDVMLLGLTV